MQNLFNQNNSSSSKYPIFLIIFITLLGFILRIIQLTHSGIWLDETLTINYALFYWNESQFDYFGNGFFNSPFYYFIMSLWLKIFGDSPISLRFPSVLASTLLIPLIYLTVRQWINSPAPVLLICFLFSISPASIYYAQETRAYALLLFLLIVSLYYFSRWFHEQNRKFLIYCSIFLLFSFFTSLWAIFWIIALNLWVIGYFGLTGNPNENKTKLLQTWMISQIPVACIIIPYLIFTYTLPGASEQGYGTSSFQLSTLYEFIRKMGLGVCIKIPEKSYIFAGPFILAGLILGICESFRKNLFLNLGFYLMIIPFLCMILISFIHPIINIDRYGIISLPGYLILVGGGLSIFFRVKKRIWIGWLLILFMTVGLTQSIRVTWHFQKNHLGDIANYMMENSRKKEAMAFAPGFWQMNYDYFDKSNRPKLQLYSTMDVPDPEKYPRLWVVHSPFFPEVMPVMIQLNETYPYHQLIQNFPPYYTELHLYSNSSIINSF